MSDVQVYHPNIDLEGNICLNILREDWKPVLNVSSVIIGLQFLFLVGGPLKCPSTATLPSTEHSLQYGGKGLTAAGVADCQGYLQRMPSSFVIHYSAKCAPN